MKLRMIGVGIVALVILGVALFPPQRSLQVASESDADPATTTASSDESRTSSKKRVADQQQLSQEELAKQFIIEADKIITAKQLTYSGFIMGSLYQDKLTTIVEKMELATVRQMFEHYHTWHQDVYVCGVCCHLFTRFAKLAPEEALALYGREIGFAKVTEILKLSDEEEEEDLEKNPRAIPTLSLMAMVSGYPAGKPGSRQMLHAFKKTIPWQEITRAMTEDEEALVGESGMLCLMLFIGILAEECKVQPEFALAELRSLPVSDAIKVSFLSNLVDDEEIPFRVLQNAVESLIKKAEIVTDEQIQLAVAFATCIFEESPHEAEQWLATHKLPLQDRSPHELESIFIKWTPENHAIFFAWFGQLDGDLRPRIAAQKIEQLGLGISMYGVEKSEKKLEYQMLDSLVPHVSSSQLLHVIKNVAKRNHADDDNAFRELLHHLKIPEAEVQSLLDVKNKEE